ncbi:MAG: mechanosensitive ion channel family protein [Cyanobacteria bacterium J06643_4]
MNNLVETVNERLVDLTAQGLLLLPGVFLGIVVLLLTRTVANLVRRGVRRVAARALNSLSLQSLLVQFSYVTTWVAGILLASTLAFRDVGLKDIIGLLGLGSVAIGFAFQDIFKNFLAGILLLLQEPFSLGDEIIVSEFQGTVEEIALRATRIRTYQGELVVVPNSIVFTSPVQVVTGKPQRRTDLAIGVDYNTPLPHAVKTLYAAAQSVDEINTNPAIEIDITGFGDSSIDMVVRYWTKPEQKSVRRIKTQMMIALKQACDEADISIPYPIRTVYHFDQDNYSDNAPKEGISQRNISKPSQTSISANSNAA